MAERVEVTVRPSNPVLRVIGALTEIRKGTHWIRVARVTDDLTEIRAAGRVEVSEVKLLEDTKGDIEPSVNREVRMVSSREMEVGRVAVSVDVHDEGNERRDANFVGARNFVQIGMKLSCEFQHRYEGASEFENEDDVTREDITASAEFGFDGVGRHGE